MEEIIDADQISLRHSWFGCKCKNFARDQGGELQYDLE